MSRVAPLVAGSQLTSSLRRSEARVAGKSDALESDGREELMRRVCESWSARPGWFSVTVLSLLAGVR